MMFEQGSLIPTRAPASEGGAVVAELAAVSSGDERTGIVQADLQVDEGGGNRARGPRGKRSGVAAEGAGRDRRDSTRPRQDRRTRRHSPDRPRAAEAGVSFLPGGRLEEGLLPGLTITEHIELAGNSARFVDWDAAGVRAAEAIDAFRIKGKP